MPPLHLLRSCLEVLYPFALNWLFGKDASNVDSEVRKILNFLIISILLLPN